MQGFSDAVIQLHSDSWGYDAVMQHAERQLCSDFMRLWCRDVVKPSCTYAVMKWCTAALMHWCSYGRIHWCVDSVWQWCNDSVIQTVFSNWRIINGFNELFYKDVMLHWWNDSSCIHAMIQWCSDAFRKWISDAAEECCIEAAMQLCSCVRWCVTAIKHW